jgi:hypothetical protein
MVGVTVIVGANMLISVSNMVIIMCYNGFEVSEKKFFRYTFTES